MASIYAFGVGFDSKSVDMYSRRKGVIVQRHNVIYSFFGAYLLKTPFPLVVLSIDERHVLFQISNFQIFKICISDEIVRSLSRSLPRMEKCVVGGQAEVMQVLH